MRVLALSQVPAYYQIPIFRGLADHLGANFLALFGNPGHSKGIFEPSWGQIIHHGNLLDGFPFHTLSLNKKQINKSLPIEAKHEIQRIITEFAPSAVFTNRLDSAFCGYVLKYARQNGAKIVLRSTPCDLGWRPQWKKVIRKYWYWQQYRQVTAACAVGKTAREHFINAGLPQHKIFDANYCTDEWVLRPIAEHQCEIRKEERHRLGIPLSATIICYSGRFIPIKRIDMIIEIARRLQKDHNLYWILAGYGPLWETTNEQIKKYALKHIKMPGLMSREQIYRLYATSDLLVLPSDSEPYGVVTQEAMMFGCACIVSDTVGSGYDLIRNGKTGMIFPCGNIQAFESAVANMARVIRTNNNLPSLIRQSVADRSVTNTIKGVMKALRYAHED